MQVYPGFAAEHLSTLNMQTPLNSPAAQLKRSASDFADLRSFIHESKDNLLLELYQMVNQSQ